ncbi:MAG: M20 family metallo-hydrolase [Alphaproteobacteria bacterium]
MMSHAAESPAHRVAAAVDQERLWRWHMEIARFGATGRGGVNRQALTPEEAEARVQVLAWARELGFAASVDDIGNLFIRREGTDATASPVAAGSHLDSQPAGGNYDGVFGVLAALETMAAAGDAGVSTVRPLEAVVWTNEEGARFQPPTMGSSVYAGALSLAEALAIRDPNGVALADALEATLARMGVEARRALGAPMSAYLEAHIEQGPVLEATERRIGVVSGIQGLRWFRIDVAGEESHAGTAPLATRKDAFVAAVEMVKGLQALMHDETDTVRFTVGRFEVSPNSPNTVPGRVLFTVDFRHPDAGVLARLGDRIERMCRAHAGACGVTVTETINSEPTQFDPAVRDLIRDAAARQRLPHMDMVSGATHDAKFMAGLWPTGMIFVPCAGGISHNEAESATPEDLAAGARVLAEVMVALAGA